MANEVQAAAANGSAPAQREADDLPAAGIFRLAIGLLQGLALYFLERQREKHGWPATDHYLFVVLAAVSLLVPVFVLQAGGRMSRVTLVIWSVVATAIVAGLAWYDVYRQAPDLFAVSDGMPTLSLLFFTFAGLFITQSLIAAGDADASFLTRYRNYFDATWKFGVQLALAAAFVGAFWAMLWLGSALFELIKLTFFRELIDHSWFSIPATTLAIAAAIHLTDVRAQLVAGVRAVGLTLLSWLLPLMTVLVAGFIASLGFTGLASLWETRWAVRILLVAAGTLVVLINAAYQDGEAASARPRVLRYAELLASVLLVPLVFLAAYALALRVEQYGWTIDRIATLACILVASCYALGYTAAALFSLLGGQWMWALESVNIFVAFLILVILGVLFTPVADPARLSVLSQVARLESGMTKPAAFDFGYLMYQGGRYGRAALRQLANWKAGTSAAQIRMGARDALSLPRTRVAIMGDAAATKPAIPVYPSGRRLPDYFLNRGLHNDWSKQGVEVVPACLMYGAYKCDAIFMDVDGDGADEILFLSVNGSGPTEWWDGTVMKADGQDKWHAVGHIAGTFCKATRDALLGGHVQLTVPRSPFRQIEVEGQTVQIIPYPTKQKCQ